MSDKIDRHYRLKEIAQRFFKQDIPVAAGAGTLVLMTRSEISEKEKSDFTSQPEFVDGKFEGKAIEFVNIGI